MMFRARCKGMIRAVSALLSFLMLKLFPYMGKYEIYYRLNFISSLVGTMRIGILMGPPFLYNSLKCIY